MLKEMEIPDHKELELDYFISDMFYLYFFRYYLFYEWDPKRMREFDDKR
jgi:hypothetical protein